MKAIKGSYYTIKEKETGFVKKSDYECWGAGLGMVQMRDDYDNIIVFSEDIWEHVFEEANDQEEEEYNEDDDYVGKYRKDPITPIYTKLTRREYFAAMAMQGILAYSTGKPENVSVQAVQHADALINELNKPQS